MALQVTSLGGCHRVLCSGPHKARLQMLAGLAAIWQLRGGVGAQVTLAAAFSSLHL